MSECVYVSESWEFKEFLHSILAASNTALFWTEGSDALFGRCWSLSYSISIISASFQQLGSIMEGVAVTPQLQVLVEHLVVLQGLLTVSLGCI